MGAHTPKQIKDAIMAKVELGHPISALAEDYKVTASSIYAWVKAKDARGLQSLPDTKLTPDEQVEHLTAEYVKRVKAILIKQIQDSIKNLNL